MNQDYQLLHALCRFFFDKHSASHENSDRLMIPFLRDMANLYEQFAAELLKTHISEGFFVKQQHRMILPKLF